MEPAVVQNWGAFVCFGLLGLLAGLVADSVNARVRRRLQGNVLAAVAAQMAVVALVPAVLLQVGMTSFVGQWQTTTAGLFFASALMGTQSNLFATAQAGS